MKLKFILGLIGISISVILGITSVTKFISNQSAITKYEDDIHVLQQSTADLNNSSNQLLSQISDENGDVIWLNDSAMAQALGSLTSATVSEIVAYTGSVNNRQELLTTQNITDVEFFNSSVTAICYKFNITDLELFIEEIRTLNPILDEFFIDEDNSIASLTVSTTAGIYETINQTDDNQSADSIFDSEILDENSTEYSNSGRAF